MKELIETIKKQLDEYYYCDEWVFDDEGVGEIAENVRRLINRLDTAMDFARLIMHHKNRYEHALKDERRDMPAA